MQIEIDYIDHWHIRRQVTKHISYLAFLKHAALAAQGYLPTLAAFKRAMGMFLVYSSYLKRRTFNASRFSLPVPRFSDPTEKGQFSTIAGKAIADYLAKELNGASATYSYESAMIMEGHKLQGQRPDLYCVSKDYQFAVESKGQSDRSISSADMIAHKSQAQSGPLTVHFSCASVAYNLFHLVKVNYYDPINEEVLLNEGLNAALRNLYYSQLRQEIEGLSEQQYDVFKIQDRALYQIDLFRGSTIKFYVSGLTPYLLIDPEYIFKEGGNIYERLQGEDFYLDVDGIGIRLY